AVCFTPVSIISTLVMLVLLASRPTRSCDGVTAPAPQPGCGTVMRSAEALAGDRLGEPPLRLDDPPSGDAPVQMYDRLPRGHPSPVPVDAAVHQDRVGGLCHRVLLSRGCRQDHYTPIRAPVKR